MRGTGKSCPLVVGTSGRVDGTEDNYLETLVDLVRRPSMTVPLCDCIGHANQNVGQIVLLPEHELLGNAAVNGLGSNILGFAQMLACVVNGGLHGLDLCGNGSNLMFSALHDLFGLHVITCAVVDTTVEIVATICDDIVLGNGGQDLVEQSLVCLATSDRERRMEGIISLQSCLSHCVPLHFGVFSALVGAGGLHCGGRDTSVSSGLSWSVSGASRRR